MEIQFQFYTNTTIQKAIESIFFDTRSGLDNVIYGLDWSEVETDDRLLHQLERALDVDLSFLDYWNEAVHGQYLEIDTFLKSLKELGSVLMANPNYYQQIDYPYVPNDFLPQVFLEAIEALIKYFEDYRRKGATLLKIKTL
ncbi:MAG: hypothetical protein AAF960_01980 [Bacteroidota bacterium]